MPRKAKKVISEPAAPSYKFADYRGTDTRKAHASTLYPNPRFTTQLRPRIYNLSDTSVSVDMSTRGNMVRYSRELFASMGSIGGAVLAKNQWAFSDGWNPQFKGNNVEWGQAAEAWLRDRWFPICNVRGSNFDFRTSLFLFGCSMDVDGDQLVILTTSRDGFPLLQFVAAHRIGQRDTVEKEVKSGRYRGLNINDGVITSSIGRPVAYRILGDSPEDDADISAQSSLLLCEPEWIDQTRGIPRIARTVLDNLDLQDIDFYLKRAVKLDSAQGILHYTPTGEPDNTTPLLLNAEEEIFNSAGATGTAPTNGLVIEQLAGGEINYMKAGSGETITPFRTDRPHANVENFISRMERRCLYAVGWPMELLDPSKVGGASVRLIQDLARKSIRSRQNTGEKLARLAVAWAVSKAMELELIPANYEDQWWNWSFTRPASISVDNGNEASADRDGLKLGTTSFSEIAAKKGQDWIETREQIQKETEDLLSRAQGLAKRFDISFDKALDLLSQRGPNPVAAPVPQVDNSHV
jgi:hypothetical protein